MESTAWQFDINFAYHILCKIELKSISHTSKLYDDIKSHVFEFVNRFFSRVIGLCPIRGAAELKA